ncbi:MAG: hypothetical protein K5787_15290 [Lentisphaeria bacterium]|nr:hypothetical protein [Victivallales bacterium]MCR4575122.1 hypothetical protein [Lentisphaeria bacterium]
MTGVFHVVQNTPYCDLRHLGLIVIASAAIAMQIYDEAWRGSFRLSCFQLL